MKLTLRASVNAVQNGRWPICHSLAALKQLELFRVLTVILQAASAFVIRLKMSHLASLLPAQKLCQYDVLAVVPG